MPHQVPNMQHIAQLVPGESFPKIGIDRAAKPVSWGRCSCWLVLLLTAIVVQCPGGAQWAQYWDPPGSIPGSDGQ
jgi:hypothetical protein